MVTKTTTHKKKKVKKSSNKIKKITKRIIKKKTAKKVIKKKSKSLKRKGNTMAIVSEQEIAMDFATKVYKEFDTMIKSVVLFGSTAKQDATTSSDIDIIILLDDVSIKFDEELIAWYRSRLGNLIAQNKYIKPLHISSVKLSTWWDDLIRGDPIVLNILRYGQPIIDFGGFFKPLRILLKEGKIKSSPEAIYTLLERAPTHLTRSKQAMLAVIDGLYWCMVDASHAALIAADIMPSSPEKIPEVLMKSFVSNKLLAKKYVESYSELHSLAKDIVHGNTTEIKGKILDDLFLETDDFLRTMAKLVDELVKQKHRK